MWVMCQLCDGPHGSWVTKDDPFPSLLYNTVTHVPQFRNPWHVLFHGRSRTPEDTQRWSRSNSFSTSNPCSVTGWRRQGSRLVPVRRWSLYSRGSSGGKGDTDRPLRGTSSPDSWQHRRDRPGNSGTSCSDSLPAGKHHSTIEQHDRNGVTTGEPDTSTQDTSDALHFGPTKGLHQNGPWTKTAYTNGKNGP